MLKSLEYFFHRVTMTTCRMKKALTASFFSFSEPPKSKLSEKCS